MKGEKREAKRGEMEQGYWLYADGESVWGVNLARCGGFGVRIDGKLHCQAKEDKLKWLAEHEAKEKKAAEEKEKAA